MDGLYNRLQTAEERINELEERLEENIHTRLQRDKYTENSQDIEDQER